MNAYPANRSWSDQYLPDVKRLVGAHLLKTAPDELDWNEATDLVMLDAKDKRVAVRVRRPGYAANYPYDFTIRTRVRSGGPTELQKIINGKGDLMFYGHAHPSGIGMASWWLIDLKAFRAALIRATQNGQAIRCGDKVNGDGTAFKWFDIRSFPSDPPLVVARSGTSRKD